MRRKTRGIKANQRFAFILFVFMVILTVLFGRVLYWKVVHGAEFEAAAKNQQINRYDLVNAANRGSILDRNEQVLAVSTAVYNVVLDPLQLAEEDDAKKTKKTFDTLCDYFPDLNYEDLEYHITKNQETGKINTPTHWKYLVKGVERSVKEELEKKKLLGVYFEQSSKRSYPLKTLACHLIGFNNTWGLEGYYNDEMTGTPGRSFYPVSGGGQGNLSGLCGAGRQHHRDNTGLQYSAVRRAGGEGNHGSMAFGERGGNRDEPEYGGNLRDGFCGHL